MYWQAVGLAVCLLLAGCNAVPGAAQSEQASTPTVTPAPAPRETPVIDDTALPPGLSTDSVTNATRLARAHRAALANESFVLRRDRLYTRRTAGSVGQQIDRTAWTVVAADGQYVHNSSSVQSWVGWGYRRRVNHSVYANGSTQFSRRVVDGRASYSRRPGNGTEWLRNETSRIIRATLASDDAQISRAGNGFYRVVVTGSDGLTITGLSNYSAVLLVDDEGFVRQFRVDYRTETPSDLVFVTREFTFQRRGGVALDRPEWLARANRSGT